MSVTNAAHKVESVAQPTIPAHAGKLGVDREGAVHHYSAMNDRVYIVENGDVREQPLDGRPVKDWIGYVDGERGWEVLHYREGGLTGLFQSLSAGGA